MARKKYRITLSEEEQKQLDDLTRKGKAHSAFLSGTPYYRFYTP